MTGNARRAVAFQPFQKIGGMARQRIVFKGR
jgi:hypothetical protein